MTHGNQSIIDKQSKNRVDNTKWLKPWKPGQSGNPKGRPKGKSMKEYARDYLASMDDDQRYEFMKAIDVEIIWKMSEGNPATQTDLTSGGKPIPIIDIHGVLSDNSHKEDRKIK